MLSLLSHLPHRECLVIESDWPEYEPVWQMIERRMNGQLPVSAAEELEAVLHWRGKPAQAISERDALQQLLNERDEQNHSLEQRHQAEQQACQAAEQDAARYRWLRNATPYRFKKMQDAATTDGGDVLSTQTGSTPLSTPPSTSKPLPLQSQPL